MTNYLSNILQDEGEISAYCDLLKQNEVKSYLEVGSKFGGSLWRAAQMLPKGSRIVSIDLPQGTKAWGQSRVSLQSCIDDLRRQGYDAQVIWGNSQSQEIINKAKALGPYDAIMLDADHRLPGVTKDWESYSPLGKIVAFHDIAWRRAPEWVGTRIDVPEFWNSLKMKYRHKEIVLCHTGKNNGIGVLWRE